MPSIFPDVSNGGIVIRDIDGNCLNPPGVVNAYCPPLPYQSTCPLTALPANCDARITSAQINAFASEMLSFASCLDPTGAWDCGSLQNLCNAFNVWHNDHLNVDGVTIIGTGVPGDPWRSVSGGDGGTNNVDGVTLGGIGTPLLPFTLLPQGAVDAICADDTAADNLADCLRSTDGGNGLGLGSDGRLFAASNEMVIASVAPVAPVAGLFWYNTAAGVVSGISGGAIAFWTGAAWQQITFGSFTIGFNSNSLANGVSQRAVISGYLLQSGPNEIIANGVGTLSIQPVPGKYIISAGVRLLPSITPAVGSNVSLNMVSRILVNNANAGVDQMSQNTIQLPDPGANSNAHSLVIAPSLLTLAGGDVVSLQNTISTGAPNGNCNFSMQSASTWMTFQRVG